MSAGSADEESNSKIQYCSHCSKTFRYRSERIRHEMSHSASFECETCRKKFSFISALRRHQKQHKRNESVKCEKCNKKFRDKELLKRHVNYSHKVTLPCPECNSIFHSEQALQTHMKTHRPVSERRYKCNYLGCSKSFNFSHHLKHHELTHTNVKQHYCCVCGKGFIQYHHLKEHMMSHNPSEYLKCDFPGCGKKFTTEYARKRHKLTHRAKPDSGISSDSNSCEASSPSKQYIDFVLCASCGDYLPQSDLPIHSKKCGDEFIFSSHGSCSISSDYVAPIKEKQAFEKTKLTAKELYEKDLGGCNTAVGGCIMGANSCVCAQISQANDEHYDFAPIDNIDDSFDDRIHTETVGSKNNIDFIDKYSEVVMNFLDNNGNDVVLNKTDPVNDLTIPKKHINQNIDIQSSVNNICEGCNCASTCNVKERLNCNGNKKLTEYNYTSNVEYTTEGVVKIKDAFDIDIPNKLEDRVPGKTNMNKESDDSVPFSTCKDMIGHCIAEGSGGCLCARMIMDEQQAMAQEIDDITPIPKTENYTCVST